MSTSLEICAGGGGTALGLEWAGFRPIALVENDPHACRTLRQNRPKWSVLQVDVQGFSAIGFQGIDLLSGGVPCPPFSVAGKRLGSEDERDLFPEVIRLAGECGPKAIMVENVRGLLDPIFDTYRENVAKRLAGLGYACEWRMLNACDFGVPQLRPRAVLVALRSEYAERFTWPMPQSEPPPTVGEALYKEMASRGWPGAEAWRDKANTVAPTLVGGSKKHGGPDLGPTRARKAWALLGVEGRSLATEPPGFDHEGVPKLSVQMTATLQGFPTDWQFVGGKTQAYRQVGNAFPPQVAAAVGRRIHTAINPAGPRTRTRHPSPRVS